ncbi:ubiA prenyltransferase family protein [Mycobacterium xenopi 3993]|nr:ubiA prenyltransferase family protein [Mycobacterium xenopi 3993]
MRRTGVQVDGARVGSEEGVEAAAADHSEHPLIVPWKDRAVATVRQWVAGARPRTLPNAVAPVVVGTGAAAWLHAAVWWKALLALAVAVAMIVGVNFANDYSDGIRGTDDERAGRFGWWAHDWRRRARCWRWPWRV